MNYAWRATDSRLFYKESIYSRNEDEIKRRQCFIDHLNNTFYLQLSDIDNYVSSL